MKQLDQVKALTQKQKEIYAHGMAWVNINREKTKSSDFVSSANFLIASESKEIFEILERGVIIPVV